ncbi:MAG: AraC-like DNA-binding protein [Phenylobacterium sp.]|jgi:AraC-like DNA-binding protein
MPFTSSTLQRMPQNNKPLTDKNLGWASVPAVNQYLAQAEFEGIDTQPILAQLAISQAILQDSQQHISGIKFQQLIKQLLEHSHDPFFGLHSSHFVRPDSYSILGLISQNCRTFGEALTKIQPFEQLVGDMGFTQISQSATTTQIQWICQYTDSVVTRQMVDNCLSSWVMLTRQLIGQQHSPHQVHLQSGSPSLADQLQYQRLFNCPVLFNQPIDALVVNNELLNVKLNQANHQLLTTLEHQAKTVITSLSQIESLPQKVAILVNAQLPQGLPTLAMIAGQLNISAKTLQRRLKADNSRYITILNQVRLSQTHTLLAMSGLSLIDISELVGFSEPRSFYRWFKQMTGHSPRTGI